MKNYYVVYFHCISSDGPNGWLDCKVLPTCPPFALNNNDAKRFEVLSHTINAAEKRLSNIKSLFPHMVFTYQIFSSVDSKEMEKAIDELNEVVSFKWMICTLDLLEWVNKHCLNDKISWKNIRDPEYPHFDECFTNVCFVNGTQVKRGQYICYNKTTRNVWISDWDATSNVAERNEYEYLKSQYTKIDRYLELKKKFE